MPPPFGAWLRQQRDRSGLSQAEVAALLDASVQSVMCWEKGRRFPRRDVEESYRRRIALAADEAVQMAPRIDTVSRPCGGPEMISSTRGLSASATRAGKFCSR